MLSFVDRNTYVFCYFIRCCCLKLLFIEKLRCISLLLFLRRFLPSFLAFLTCKYITNVIRFIFFLQIKLNEEKSYCFFRNRTIYNVLNWVFCVYVWYCKLHIALKPIWSTFAVAIRKMLLAYNAHRLRASVCFMHSLFYWMSLLLLFFFFFKWKAVFNNWEI